jgi:hypothetical protein
VRPSRRWRKHAAAEAETAGEEIEALYVELETVEVGLRGHRETLAAIEEKRSGHDGELRGLCCFKTSSTVDKR